jgi:Smg protein
MYYQNQVDGSFGYVKAVNVQSNNSQSDLITALPTDAQPLFPSSKRTLSMNENLIDVLVYIYENYMDSEQSVPVDQITLEEELISAGFQKGEVNKAFDWLDELAWCQGSLSEYREAQPNGAIRVYTDLEQQKMDMDIRSLLMNLEQMCILDPMSRELVIERCMAIETEELTTDDVKWVVLLVLLNQPGQENAFALMEELVYNGEPPYLH